MRAAGKCRADGFIVELTDECALEPSRIKPILSLRGAEPVILPELMALAKWMRLRYNCNPRRGPAPDVARRHAPGQRARKTRRVAHLARRTLPRAARASRRSLPVCAREMWRPRSLPAAPLRALVQKGVVKVYKQGERRAPRRFARRDAARPAPHPRAGARRIRTVRRAGAWRRPFFVARRHRLGQDGGLHPPRAPGAGGGQKRHRPSCRRSPSRRRWSPGSTSASARTAAVLHSGLSQGERFDEWRRIRSGEARVVIGARSAVFAPLANVGVIVVDEEHEGSYQSDRRPRYDAREVAWRRAEGAGAGAAPWQRHARPSLRICVRCPACARKTASRSLSFPSASAAAPCRRWKWWICAASSSAATAPSSAPASRKSCGMPRARAAGHAAHQPARAFVLRLLPQVRLRGQVRPPATSP